MKYEYDIYLAPKMANYTPSDTKIATCYMLGAAHQIVENMRHQLQCYEPYIVERRVGNE